MTKSLGTSVYLFICFFFMMAALFLVFIFVPVEEEMGVVQRIFYFHVPLAWVAFLAFFIVFLTSIFYLRERNKKWDYLANSSAEIGFLFTSLVLITGSIWAKAVWKVWWTWDARLTTTLILWFIYLAYLMVRAYAIEKERGARLAAVVGIVGFLNVPIVFLATTLWRTQHPGLIIFFQESLALSMLLTLLVCLIAFTFLYLCLLTKAITLRQMEAGIKQLKQQIREKSI